MFCFLAYFTFLVHIYLILTISTFRKPTNYPTKFIVNNFLCAVLPHIHPFAFEEEANSGDSVQLTCHASKGDLPLTIKWLHNGRPIFAHLGVVTNKIGDRISLLTIASVTDQNGGDYTCVAENRAGQVNFTAKLYVNGELNSNLKTKNEKPKRNRINQMHQNMISKDSIRCFL